MGTAKRERQKEGRQARLEAEAAEQRSAGTRRVIIRSVVIGVIVVAVVFIYSQFSGDDDSDAVATTQDDSAETAGADDDSATESAQITDDDPVEPLSTETPGLDADGATPCPATEDQERFINFDAPLADCLEDGASYTATFETSEGQVVVELDTERTPNTTNNFVGLARYGYYDNTEIFRTEPSIAIIQGGSPHTNTAFDQGPGYSLTDEGGEFSLDDDGTYTGPFTYEPGQLVMARSQGPDASGAQFFFTIGQESALLDSQGTYLNFGNVVKGMSVLEAILDLHQPDATGGGGPSRTVTIESIIIEQS